MAPKIITPPTPIGCFTQCGAMMLSPLHWTYELMPSGPSRQKHLTSVKTICLKSINSTMCLCEPETLFQCSAVNVKLFLDSFVASLVYQSLDK